MVQTPPTSWALPFISLRKGYFGLNQQLIYMKTKVILFSSLSSFLDPNMTGRKEMIPLVLQDGSAFSLGPVLFRAVGSLPSNSSRLWKASSCCYLKGSLRQKKWGLPTKNKHPWEVFQGRGGHQRIIIPDRYNTLGSMCLWSWDKQSIFIWVWPGLWSRWWRRWASRLLGMNVQLFYF